MSPCLPTLVTLEKAGLMWPEMVDTAESVPEKKPEELRITEATRSGGTSWDLGPGGSSVCSDSDPGGGLIH